MYPFSAGDRQCEPFDDARLVDLEADEESPFLRAQRRVSARRGPLPKRTVNYLKWLALALFAAAMVVAAGAAIYRYGERSARFRIESSDQIEVAGAQHVTRGQIMEVMGGDIGRNIFFVPLAQRRRQIEQIAWVESASVMRFVPNRLRVEIHERTPVAFARIGSHISLIDASGTLMELSPAGKHKYSFPVITGMSAGEPRSLRAARMKNYSELIRQLDASGARNSQALSEVDLTDAGDTKAVISDPNGEVLVHLGSGNYLQRYQTYVANIQKWRERYQKLESVDLRYDGQIIVNPDFGAIPHQPALTQAAAKAAMAAGVKPAALVNYEKYVTHPPAAPAAARPVKAAAKPAAKHPTRRIARRRRARGKKSVTAVAKKPAASLPIAAAPASSKPAQADSAKTAPEKAAPALRSSATSVLRPSAPPPATTATQQKPSAGIPKEAPPN